MRKILFIILFLLTLTAHGETNISLLASGPFKQASIMHSESFDSFTLNAGAFIANIEDMDFKGFMLGLGYNIDSKTRFDAFSILWDGTEVKSNFTRLGAYRWVTDQVELGLMVGKDNVSQPPKAFIDIDARLVQVPPLLSNHSVSPSVKILINKTTVGNFRYTLFKFSNRPQRHILESSLRKYFIDSKITLHLDLNTVRDAEQVGRETDHGKIQGDSIQVAVAKDFGDLTGGFSYRFHREVEETRAYNLKRVLGSDMVGGFITIDNYQIGLYQYLTNTNQSVTLLTTAIRI
jgi:hypothetical protein